MISKALILFSLFIITISISYGAIPQKNSALPTVRETVLNFVVKDRTSVESYSYLKDISISAINFIQSDGNLTSAKLETLIKVVSIRLEKDAIVLRKSDIVATIITALNS